MWKESLDPVSNPRPSLTTFWRHISGLFPAVLHPPPFFFVNPEPPQLSPNSNAMDPWPPFSTVGDPSPKKGEIYWRKYRANVRV